MARTRTRSKKLANDFQINVGFEKCHAHFAQGNIHIGFGQFAFAGEAFENAFKFIGETLKHRHHY